MKKALLISLAFLAVGLTTDGFLDQFFPNRDASQARLLYYFLIALPSLLVIALSTSLVLRFLKSKLLKS